MTLPGWLRVLLAAVLLHLVYRVAVFVMISDALKAVPVDDRTGYPLLSTVHTHFNTASGEPLNYTATTAEPAKDQFPKQCVLIDSYLDAAQKDAKSSGSKVRVPRSGFEDFVVIDDSTAVSCAGDIILVGKKAPVDLPPGICMLLRVDTTTSTTLPLVERVTLVPLALEGFPFETVSFMPHGMSIRRADGTIYVVNHGYTRGGERVEVFRLDLTPAGPTGNAAPVLRHLGSITSPWLTRHYNGILNDLAVVPSGGAFYVSGMLSAPSPMEGLQVTPWAKVKQFASLIMGWGASTVVYCAFDADKLSGPGAIAPATCAVAGDGFAMANGVEVVEGGRTVLVADNGAHTLAVMEACGSPVAVKKAATAAAGGDGVVAKLHCPRRNYWIHHHIDNFQLALSTSSADGSTPVADVSVTTTNDKGHATTTTTATLYAGAMCSLLKTAEAIDHPHDPAVAVPGGLTELTLVLKRHEQPPTGQAPQSDLGKGFFASFGGPTAGSSSLSAMTERDVAMIDGAAFKGVSAAAILGRRSKAPIAVLSSFIATGIVVCDA